MTKDFQMVHKTHADKKCSLDFLSRSVEENVRAYHRSFPVYKETPLACLKETAKALGVSSIYVKDESYRFGLNAFKVLGGSYAMGHYLSFQKSSSSFDFLLLMQLLVRESAPVSVPLHATLLPTGYFSCRYHCWKLPYRELSLIQQDEPEILPA